MRHLRHLRTFRGREPDLPRAVRAAAPRAGGCRHCHVGRREAPDPQGARLRGRQFQRGDDQPAGGDERRRPRAVFHRRRQRHQERAADPDRLRPRRDRHLPQRQPRERPGAARDARARRIDLPDDERYRGAAAPVRAVEGAHARRGADRIRVAGAGGVFAGPAHQGSPDRGTRSARLPPADARPARRQLYRLFGNLRAGSD